MRPNFRPGPYRVNNYKDSLCDELWIESSGILIARIEKTIKDCEATANLLAAAPEMYAALERSLKAWNEIDEITRDQIKSALNKARGIL